MVPGEVQEGEVLGEVELERALGVVCQRRVAARLDLLRGCTDRKSEPRRTTCTNEGLTTKVQCNQANQLIVGSDVQHASGGLHVMAGERQAVRDTNVVNLPIGLAASRPSQNDDALIARKSNSLVGLRARDSRLGEVQVEVRLVDGQ